MTVQLDPGEDIWSPQEVAELIGQTTSTLAKWRHMGGGPVFAKAGREVHYFKSDVMAWLRENRYQRTDQKAPSPERAA